MQGERFTLFYEETDVESNWFMGDFKMGDKTFNCSEQAMMYLKAVFHGDAKQAALIMKAKTAQEAKALGRGVSNFKKEEWDAASRHIVYWVCLHKFNSSDEWKYRLFASKGTTLVEASPSDMIWGVGLAKNDARIFNRKNWRGTNWLGQVLTQLRDDLLAGTIREFDGVNWRVYGLKFD